MAPTSVLGLGLLRRWAFILYFLMHFCFTLFELRLLSLLPMYFMNKSCKILSLQYMWKYVNSKCICVISLFISFVLNLSWRSDLVVKDRQQIAMQFVHTCCSSLYLQFQSPDRISHRGGSASRTKGSAAMSPGQRQSK
jgi:hypothetical protein